jgi:hypothetical protein
MEPRLPAADLAAGAVAIELFIVPDLARPRFAPRDHGRDTAAGVVLEDRLHREASVPDHALRVLVAEVLADAVVELGVDLVLVHARRPEADRDWRAGEAVYAVQLVVAVPEADRTPGPGVGADAGGGVEAAVQMALDLDPQHVPVAFDVLDLAHEWRVDVGVIYG